jgi:hypothetical protein
VVGENSAAGAATTLSAATTTGLGAGLGSLLALVIIVAIAALWVANRRKAAEASLLAKAVSKSPPNATQQQQQQRKSAWGEVGESGEDVGAFTRSPSMVFTENPILRGQSLQNQGQSGRKMGSQRLNSTPNAAHVSFKGVSGGSSSSSSRALPHDNDEGGEEHVVFHEVQGDESLFPGEAASEAMSSSSGRFSSSSRFSSPGVTSPTAYDTTTTSSPFSTVNPLVSARGGVSLRSPLATFSPQRPGVEGGGGAGGPVSMRSPIYSPPSNLLTAISPTLFQSPPTYRGDDQIFTVENPLHRI